MTMVTSTAAFAVHSVMTLGVSSFLPKSAALNAVPTSTCSVEMNAGALVDCTSGAIAFFNSLRIPSSLVAGSALATLFSLVKLTDCDVSKNRLESLTLQLYHVCCLYAFFMAITSIVTTTTASTTLLLGKHNPMATDVYHFLKREFNFEFVLTRFSFLTSLISFLTAVGGRTLLEFDLLKDDRRRHGRVVALITGGMVSFLVSYINSRLNCWYSLIGMTKEVAYLVTSSVSATRRPLGALSVLCFGSAAIFSVLNFMQTRNGSAVDES